MEAERETTGPTNNKYMSLFLLKLGGNFKHDSIKS